MERDILLSVKIVEAASIVSMTSANDDVLNVEGMSSVSMVVFGMVVKSVRALRYAHILALSLSAKTVGGAGSASMENEGPGV